MSEVTTKHIESALSEAGVSMDTLKNIVFPHGFKIVSKGEEKLVYPMSRDELAEAYERHTGEKPSEHMLTGSCVFRGGSCSNEGCSGHCELAGANGEYWCICK